MAGVNGARLTTTILSDQLAIDLGDQISLLEPSVQPLAVFTRAAGKAKTVATKFSWLTDASKARYDAVNNASGITNSATTIAVDHGAYFAQYDLVLNTRTGEIFRVSSVSTNDLTVVRGVGTTAAAMNDNDELLIVASAQPENDVSRVPASDNPVKSTNYTQIIREPWAQSGSLEASAFQVNPADWDHQARKHGIEHAKDIEYALMFGQRSTTTVNGQELRTTGGIIPQIVTNQTDAGGTLTEAEFNASMASSLRYGSESKLALASATALGALNGFAMGKLQTRNDETTYGMKVSHFQSPFGDLNVVYHRLLEGSKYGGYIVGVDVNGGDVKYRYLANDSVSRDTKVLTNRQENDRDGRKSEYLTECGCEWGSEKTHFLITGITG